jgi:colanic acid/amylovoran biosynthesis glycosyltransferase
MKQSRSSQPTVLIFKENLLPVSETFIEAQARHLVRFQPCYAGLGQAKPSLTIPAESILLTRGYSAAAALEQKLYRRLGFAPRFHRKAASVSPRLVHAHFASGGRSALPLVRHLKVPLVVTLHGSDVTMRIDYKQRYSRLWDEASAFICVSDFIRRKAIEAGFPENKLQVHYIGIDRQAFRPHDVAKQPDTVLFVGRLVEKKGCAFLLRAMAEVQRQRPEARTVIIGDGPLRSSLEALAKELKLSCQFLGSQPSTVVREWLSAARVFCAPSVTAANGDSEGLPTVIVEAQAMGVPVVSTHHAGIPEVVLDGETGLLAPESDSTTLTQHLLRLLEDEAFWNSCVERGNGWIRQQFDLKSQTQELERIYSAACE